MNPTPKDDSVTFRFFISRAIGNIPMIKKKWENGSVIRRW